MAQAKQITQNNTFVAGLITEATELSFPPNATSDELNCDLYTKGNRTCRRGFDYETDYALSSFTVTDTELTTFAITAFDWTSVGGVGTTNFTVVQLGNTLYFFNVLQSLSSGEMSFTVDLNTYVAPAFADTSEVVVSMSTGRGDLFVVSPVMEPIRISYDATTVAISVEQIEIRVRDFDGVDDGLAVDEEPATLSAEHEYNLKNQGWFESPDDRYNNITLFKTVSNPNATYPSNNLQWFLAKNTSGIYDGYVNTLLLRRLAIGTTPAPKGHYIVDPFRIDRSTVSGVAGIPVATTDGRPNSVSFFAGRVVYSVKNDVYISELLNVDRDNAGKCYQDADPTAEDISDLIATDGVVIPIPDAGEILGLRPLGNILVVFANNGVWAIGGTDGGFKSTDFSITKITGVGLLTRVGIVDADGTLFYLSESGIYVLQEDKVTGFPTAVSLTDNTIKTLYTNIPATERENMVGKYDPANQVITWLYKDVDETPASSSPHYYNRQLKLHLGLGAFYPWKVERLIDSDGDFVECPFIAGHVKLPSLTAAVEQRNLITSDGTLVVTSTAEQITYGEDFSVGNSTFIKYLVVVPDTADDTNALSFGFFNNNSLTDWETYDTIEYDNSGADYSAFLETGFDLQGDMVRQKQAPYVVTHMKKTETEYNASTEVFTNPSGMFLYGKWDFTNASRAGEWSTSQQIYRILNKDIPTETTVDYDYGNNVITSRVRIRGRGRALQLRFERELGKDFNLLGWGIVYTGNTEV